MWTPATRAELARESLPYATVVSDAEWAVVAPLMPAPASTGRPWRWPLRAVLDGILYVLRTGCAWRHLPLEFPPWGTVHRWFLRLSQDGMFERLAHALTMAVIGPLGCARSCGSRARASCRLPWASLRCCVGSIRLRPQAGVPLLLDSWLPLAG